ncbi:uncharacterized protein LOC62_01G000290 [Vanrija pseudolonga]|uniref:F-box domain-containing protein n=1 Tax=Vanrija pseudolonga TaxID=143232 RepID=A0AAF1BGS6_9TREE|nr:hypothetical protein LOC62_01G000290 [Vanrija pseudolonga]
MEAASAIDHTAYPDVLDEIIELAPPQALVRLRATSRDFCTRADRVLLRHVVYAWRSDAKGNQHADLLAPFTRSRPPQDGGQRGERAVLPLKPECVEVLDLVNAWPAPMPSTLLDRFTSLHTLRRMGAGLLSRSADRTVVYPARTVADFYAIDDFRPGAGVSNIPVVPDPHYASDACTRYVLHLKWREGPSWAGKEVWSLSTLAATRLQELDIVLWSYGDVDAPQPGARVVGLLQVAARLWDGLVAGSTRLTVVGLEKVYRWHIDQRDRSTERGLHGAAELWRAVLRAGNSGGPEAEYDAAVANVTFLTLDEWLDSLGDRRAAEGEWPDALCGTCGNSKWYPCDACGDEEVDEETRYS